jgi:CRP/FNR family transcriptional regulator
LAVEVKKMPSANLVEFDKPLREQVREHEADLHSLLHEFPDSNVSHLNSLHRRGKVLFAEGEPARGIYLLRSGRASLSISSSEGRVVILRLAQAGDVLGLNSVLRNSSYDTTVKTLEPCRTDFISRAQLLDLMQRRESACHAVLKILSHELTQLTDRARLLLPQTVNARLARLLLEWSKTPEEDTTHTIRIDRVWTHEELAQMICSSRETVTRLLASLSRRQIIQISSDSIWIRDRAALETLALV